MNEYIKICYIFNKSNLTIYDTYECYMAVLEQMAKQNKKLIRENFRRVCLMRDKNRCVMCDARPETLEVHHVKDRTEIINGGYVKENGISLCAQCHIKAEVYHSTGKAEPGYAPEDLYNKIGSNYEKAVKASEKL